MASTFTGIEMGKKSLIAHQTAIQTTGHNMANAETKGYARQRVVMETESPLYTPGLSTRAQVAGQIGQGVVTASIDRIRDTFVDDRLISEHQNLGFWNTRKEYINHLERVYNEPGRSSMREILDQFWASWQDLANDPEERSIREVVRQRGFTLTNEINHQFEGLNRIQQKVNGDIKFKVEKVNEFALEIRDLNVEIQNSKNLGDNPNDLMDKRDLLIDELSQIVNISVGRTNKDEFFVNLDGEYLVQGSKFQKIQLIGDPRNKGFFNIAWEKDAAYVPLLNGELKSLFDLRDVVLDRHISQLNNFAINLSDLINEVHIDGFGLDAKTDRQFFNFIPLSESPNADYDLDRDGINESSVLFRITGTNEIDVEAEMGSAGTITFDSNIPGQQPIEVNYYAADKIKNIIDRINNSGAELVSYVNHKNQLALKATTSMNNEDFAIRHIEDSGGFLTTLTGILKSSGTAGAYDWKQTNAINQIASPQEKITRTPMFNVSSWINLDEAVRLNVDTIAASSGTDSTGDGNPDTPNGIGDGNHALLIADIKNKRAMISENETFIKYFTTLIAKVGASSEQAEFQTDLHTKQIQNLENVRQSKMGVNLDEEMANLVMFQHGYNASARIVTYVDRMLDTIINRMGV